jgi:hypothetical protein
MTMFGVLGLDSIIPKETLDITMKEKTNDSNVRAFGIDYKCYDSKIVRDNLLADFEQKCERIDYNTKLDAKYLKSKQEMTGSILKKQGSTLRKNEDLALDKIKKIMEDPKELEKYVKKM